MSPDTQRWPILQLTRSIPIPANTRGVPESSYGPTSPQAVLSTSPRATLQTPGSFAGSIGTSPGSHFRHRSATLARQLTAFLPPDYPLAEEPEGVATPKRQGKQKILLLENINLDAANTLKQQGFEVGPTPKSTGWSQLTSKVDHYTKAFSEEELIQKLPSYTAVGIRSKTKITKKVIESCQNVRNISLSAVSHTC